MEDTIRILVVEDEEDLCEIIEFNLAAEGYETESVNSAEEALGKDLSSYSLFVLDVMMGRISGFKLAEKIRKDYRLETPIIFLTARTVLREMQSVNCPGLAQALSTVILPGNSVLRTGTHDV